MLNMAQLQERLKGLSDRQLAEQMQAGSAPEYLVLTELNRRKKLRQEAQTPNQPPQGTVADEMVAGIAALPMEAPQYAEGGIVSFAGGGGTSRRVEGVLGTADSGEGVQHPTVDQRVRLLRELINSVRRDIDNRVSRKQGDSPETLGKLERQITDAESEIMSLLMPETSAAQPILDALNAKPRTPDSAIGDAAGPRGAPQGKRVRMHKAPTPADTATITAPTVGGDLSVMPTLPRGTVTPSAGAPDAALQYAPITSSGPRVGGGIGALVANPALAPAAEGGRSATGTDGVAALMYSPRVQQEAPKTTGADMAVAGNREGPSSGIEALLDAMYEDDPNYVPPKKFAGGGGVGGYNKFVGLVDQLPTAPPALRQTLETQIAGIVSANPGFMDRFRDERAFTPPPDKGGPIWQAVKSQVENPQYPGTTPAPVTPPVTPPAGKRVKLDVGKSNRSAVFPPPGPEAVLFQQMPEYPKYDDTAQRNALADLKSKYDKDTKGDKWMALAEAGFAMASGSSPYALQNLGKGAQAGIARLMEDKKARRDFDKEMANTEIALAEAKRKGDVDAVKYLMDKQKMLFEAQLGLDTLTAQKEHWGAQQALGEAQRRQGDYDREYNRDMANLTALAKQLSEMGIAQVNPTAYANLVAQHNAIAKKRGYPLWQAAAPAGQGGSLKGNTYSLPVPSK